MHSVAVVFFHKNIHKIYQREWIDKCIRSVLEQTHSEFDIFEVNYGGENVSLFEGVDIGTRRHRFYVQDFPDHTYAMNYIIEKAFASDYDVVFNTNLDDIYRPERFQKQLEYVERGYDLVSSYWTYIDENDTPGITLDAVRLSLDPSDMDRSIGIQLNKNHNVINHSGVCFTRKFWSSYDVNGNLLRYANLKPYEDLILWQRAYRAGLRLGIVDNVLIDYRIHGNQICHGDRDGKSFPKYPGIVPRRIGILLVATGRYTSFIPSVMESIRNCFLTSYPKTFFIFTDDVDVTSNSETIVTVIKRRGFPGDTLYRYHYFLKQKHNIIQLTDVVFYCDVDMKVIAPVGSEVLPTPATPLVGVRHPGFYNPSRDFSELYGTPESSPKSSAYIHPSNRMYNYIAGGFNGGLSYHFMAMCKIIKHNIDVDDMHEVVAVWHDESHLNRYYTSNERQFKILTPEFCYPESWTIPFKPTILALNKDHSGYRHSDKYLACVFKGRIGNILFEVASTIAIAKRFGLTPVFPVIRKDGHRSYRESVLSNVLRMPENKVKFSVYKEPNFYYTPITSVSPNTMLDGHFQSWRYFHDLRDEVVRALNWTSKTADAVYSRITTPQTVGVHVRRGDYLKLSRYHHNLSTEYFKTACAQFDPASTFVVVSDDITWCRGCPVFTELKNVYFVDGTTDVDDMILLSKCRGIVISNSSFSWWAAYMGNADRVVAPKQWLGVDSPPYKIEDILLPHWIAIDDSCAGHQVKEMIPGVRFVILSTDSRDASTAKMALSSLLPVVLESKNIGVCVQCDNPDVRYIVQDYVEHYPNSVKLTGLDTAYSSPYQTLSWSLSYVAYPDRLLAFMNKHRLSTRTDRTEVIVPLETVFMRGTDWIARSPTNLDAVAVELVENDPPPDAIPIRQNKFIIVIPSYNCADALDRCLNSVSELSYARKTVYVVDDASTDINHTRIAEGWCKSHNHTFIHNSTNRGALANIVNAIAVAEPDDDDVVVTIDGDDRVHPNALEIVNWAYQDDVLLTYGRFMFETFGRSAAGIRPGSFGYESAPDSVAQTKSFRDTDWVFSHLRTFKYALWKNIKPADLKTSVGQYFDVAWDLAFMYPMMEMAPRHIKYINFPLYHYNVSNPQNDFKTKQRRQLELAQIIKRKPRYETVFP